MTSSTKASRPPRILAVGALAVVLLIVAGCASDGDKSTAPAKPSSSAKAAELTVSATEPATGKYAFDVPASLDSGLITIALKNTGKEPHELQLVRVKDGTTPAQFVKDVVESEGAPIPDYVLSGGGVGAVPPGTTETVTQKLAPGTYVFLCEIGDGEAVHYKNGMLGTTTVKGAEHTGELPRADASVKAKEYGFDISGLKAGANTVSFENGGQQFHHALFFPLAPGKTFEDAKAAFESDAPPQGPPPVDFDKGVSFPVIAAGEKLVASPLTLQKGTYVVICFLTDKVGGAPHFTKGMLQKLDVP